MNQYQYVHWRDRRVVVQLTRKKRAQERKERHRDETSKEKSRWTRCPTPLPTPHLALHVFRSPLFPPLVCCFWSKPAQHGVHSATLLAFECLKKQFKLFLERKREGKVFQSHVAHDTLSLSSRPRPPSSSWKTQKNQKASTRPSAGGAARSSTRGDARRRSTTSRSRASTRR